MASGPVGLFIDWDNDGFGTGTHDDLTALVTHASYSRGSAPEITGAAQAGQAVFTVQNPNALFNPDNAAGPLFGLLRDGAPVWWGMREDGTISGSSTATVRGRFAGRVVEVVPLPQAGAGSSTPLAQIICEDPLALYGRIPVKLSDECLVPPITPTCSTQVSLIEIYDSGTFHKADAGPPNSTFVTMPNTSTVPSVLLAFVGIFNGGTTFGHSTIASPWVKDLDIPVPANDSHTLAEIAHLSLPSGSPVNLVFGWNANDAWCRVLGFSLSTSATSPVQTKFAAGASGLTLDSAPIPGNLLVFYFIGESTGVSGPWNHAPTGWTIVTAINTGATPDFTNAMTVAVRCVQEGDSATIAWDTASFSHWVMVQEWAFS